MKRLKEVLIYLKLKNNNYIFKNLNGEKVEEPSNSILKRDNYNTSYYGEPYAYDWYNSEFEDLDWRRRWTG